MANLDQWLAKLSLARDTKTVLDILSEAAKLVTQASEVQAYSFVVEDVDDITDPKARAAELPDPLIQKIYERKGLLYLGTDDKQMLIDAGIMAIAIDCPVLIAPLRQNDPIGALLCQFIDISPANQLDIINNFDQDKLAILGTAGAIALENVSIHEQLAQQAIERTAELMEVRQAADAANRIKSRYLSAASHDLRQPLQQLTSLIDLLLRQNATPETGNKDPMPTYRRMQRITAAMDKLLSTLLDLERLEQGAITPSIKDVELDSLLLTLQDDFADKASEKQLQLSIATTQQTVVTDPDLLLQILRNLLGNAIKYTQSGMVSVSASNGANFLELCISDTGPGFTAEQQILIFDPFYQIMDGRQQRASFGLGLSLVKALAETLSVPVSLSSIPGDGSCFSLTLPISEHQVEKLVDSGGDIVQVELPSRGIVLYLEDDDILVDSITLLLEMVGFAVYTASSLANTKELLAQNPFVPDIIVTDKNLLDGEDGLAVVSHLRQHFETAIPAILLTGFTERSVIEEAAKTVQSTLTKPVDVDVLIDEIESLLKNP